MPQRNYMALNRGVQGTWQKNTADGTLSVITLLLSSNYIA